MRQQLLIVNELPQLWFVHDQRCFIQSPNAGLDLYKAHEQGQSTRLLSAIPACLAVEFDAWSMVRRRAKAGTALAGKKYSKVCSTRQHASAE
jgi:hypothetical protein